MMKTETKTFGCVGNTIRTYSGIYFDLAHPDPDAIDIRDIAQGLGNTCRFGGQINEFYSVAEHSVLAAREAIKRNLPKRVVQAVFLHDAAEAYVGDVVKPLKIMLPQFAEIEHEIESAIERKYGVDLSHSAIRVIDHALLIAERRHLFSVDLVKWTGEDEAEPIEVYFECWEPSRASLYFLEMAEQLGLVSQSNA